MRNEGFPGTFGDSKDCILEGFADRPSNCPNNPKKNPQNYRPNVCDQCPSDPKAWMISEQNLPTQYLLVKQGQLSIEDLQNPELITKTLKSLPVRIDTKRMKDNESVA